MPPASIIEAVQTKYAALAAFSGKPATLWFGSAWPSSAVYPFIRFTHDGTDEETDFEYTGLEVWAFSFEVFAETAAQCETIRSRVFFNGDPPETASGFRYAQTFDVPTGYRFMELRPVGRWRLDVRDGQFAPSGAPLHVLTFDMELHVQRTA